MSFINIESFEGTISVCTFCICYLFWVKFGTRSVHNAVGHVWVS